MTVWRCPVWDSHAYDQKVAESGLTFKELARRIQPLVGHMSGTREPSVIAFHNQEREPKCYAIVCALAHVLGCQVEDFYRRT